MAAKAILGITREFFDEDGGLKIPGPGLKLLDEIPAIDYQMFAEFLPEIAAEQARGCDMVISGAARWTEDSLVGNDQLVAVLFTGVGYDHIDVKALTRAGVMLCFAPDAVRRPMAVTIITFVLALAMRLINKDRITRQGRWEERENYHGEGLTGKTLGSIGVGNIGHEMFKLAGPFGMRHLAHDPYVTQEAVDDVGVELVDMDTLLAESDFVSISVPLSDKTYHLFGEKELRKMKETAYLISTSRGSVVDEPALIQALQEGWIQGAGVDVFEQEPVDPDNPILKMDNVVVSPHSLCHTDEYFKGTWDQKLRQASQIVRGETPEALVNREVLEKPEFQARFAKFAAH
jgi:phosphoglycerate dehydrogenase-like enzyme